MQFSEEKNQIAKALIKFHSLLSEYTLKKEKKDGVKFAYLNLDKILDVVRPLLVQSELVALQALDGEHVVTTLLHASGQFVTSKIKFEVEAAPRNRNGQKTRSDMQDIGSAFTYFRRYALTALLQISAEKDDDGQRGYKSSYNTQPAPQKQKPKPKPQMPADRLASALEYILNDPNGRQYTVQKLAKSFSLSAEQIKAINEAQAVRVKADKKAAEDAKTDGKAKLPEKEPIPAERLAKALEFIKSDKDGLKYTVQKLEESFSLSNEQKKMIAEAHLERTKSDQLAKEAKAKEEPTEAPKEPNKEPSK